MPSTADSILDKNTGVDRHEDMAKSDLVDGQGDRVFHGPCTLGTTSARAMTHILAKGTSMTKINMDKKRIKITKTFLKDNEALFQDLVQQEYLPLGY